MIFEVKMLTMLILVLGTLSDIFLSSKHIVIEFFYTKIYLYYLLEAVFHFYDKIFIT